MSNIYEDFYHEIKDESGKITEIKFEYEDNFNFAYDVMDRYARECPGAVALVHKSAEGEKNVYTFSDIKRFSDKTAVMLMNLGIKKSDSVMLLLKRRFEFWISILALHKIGAVAIPTSHMVSAEDIRERAELAGAKAVICVNNDGICEKVENAIKGLKMLQIVVGREYKAFPSFDRLMEASESFFDRVQTKVSEDMLYYFTSGTNGAPKAVIHDYSYPLAHIFTAKNWHGARKGGLHLTVADSGWAKSAWGKLYGQWFVGSAIMVYDYEQFYAGDMLKLVEDEKITSFCAPPTIYKYFILEDFSKYDLSSLENVTTAGEPMPAKVSEKFQEMTGLSIREGFGQTETALQICTSIGKEQIMGSIGYSSPLYNMKIVDDNLDEVADGEIGELVIVPKDGKKPIGIFKGYLGDEEQYREVWSGGIYHTKDRAWKDKNGAFFFVGRNDDVIKSSGYRIGPSEVEDILMRHPAVFECAVTGYPSKNRGAIVKASIILKENYKPDNKLVTELQEFVKKRAAIYKYPRKIVFVDSLPRTATGKISRAVIRNNDYKEFGITK